MMTIQDLLDLSKTIAAPLFAGKTYPWEALAEIGDFILQLGPTLPAEEYEQRGENIWIARDAKIFDSAYIAGPCIIDHGAELRQCAFVRGNAIVGKNAVVGNSCELKNVVLFDNVQTPHFNYVGDSILGYKAHMGAPSRQMSRATRRWSLSKTAPSTSRPAARRSAPSLATMSRSAATAS